LRQLDKTWAMADLEQHFKVAQAAARKLPATPDDDTLLEL
jgi:hypothetical protein